MTLTLDTINQATPEQAANLLEPLVENSPEVVRAALREHPFADLPALEAAILQALRGLDHAAQVALFRRHPALAGAEAQAGTMTAESQSEQGRLGLDRLAPDDLARLNSLNNAYDARFGHPFILALVEVRDLHQMFETFERRLKAQPADEHRETLDQISTVIRSRISSRFALPATATL